MKPLCRDGLGAAGMKSLRAWGKPKRKSIPSSQEMFLKWKLVTPSSSLQRLQRMDRLSLSQGAALGLWSKTSAWSCVSKIGQESRVRNVTACHVFIVKLINAGASPGRLLYRSRHVLESLLVCFLSLKHFLPSWDWISQTPTHDTV